MSERVVSEAGPAALRPRKATAADLSHITETLAMAFYEDPVVMWFMNDASRRRDLLPGFFGAIAASYLAYDETHSLDEGSRRRSGLRPGPRTTRSSLPCSARRRRNFSSRLFGILGLMEEKHPTEPHYYLFLLGTRPEWQGRGLGSALMGPVLDACDRDTVPAYLEATSERNKELYLRHGFEVTDEIPLPDGPMMWPMWRSPR